MQDFAARSYRLFHHTANSWPANSSHSGAESEENLITPVHGMLPEYIAAEATRGLQDLVIARPHAPSRQARHAICGRDYKTPKALGICSRITESRSPELPIYRWNDR